MSIFTRIVLNAIALWVVQRLVDGFNISGGIFIYIAAGIVLGILNFFVKPILKIVSFPLIILTFGLFLLIINAIILWLLDALFIRISIDSTGALFAATVVLAIVNFLFGPFRRRAANHN